MTTTVVKTIGSGGDFTTLQAWEDASPASLVAVDQIWQGQIKASTDVFTAGLVISGTTVSSTQYVELTTATGASFRDNASVQTNALRYNASNGCAIDFATNYAIAIFNNTQDFTRISNLQVQATAANGTALQVSASTGVDINFCICEGLIDAGPVALTASGGAEGGKIRNSLVVQRKSAATHIAALKDFAAYNVTFAVPSDKTAATFGIDNRYFNVTMKNCAVFGGTTVIRGGTPTITTSYTSMTSPPAGWTNATYDTTQFADITDATRDYKIPANTSAFYDTGTTDSTNAATDIAGTSRPQGSAYDVGCWELVVSAAVVLMGQACL